MVTRPGLIDIRQRAGTVLAATRPKKRCERAMNSQHYGQQTICRPLVSNVPTPREGWTLAACPYCGLPCWKQDIEERAMAACNLLGGATVACTACAMKRSMFQEQMDAERFQREQEKQSGNN